MCTTCSPHVLSLQFSWIELVDRWTIFCHIVGYLMWESFWQRFTCTCVKNGSTIWLCNIKKRLGHDQNYLCRCVSIAQNSSQCTYFCKLRFRSRNVLSPDRNLKLNLFETFFFYSRNLDQFNLSPLPSVEFSLQITKYNQKVKSAMCNAAAEIKVRIESNKDQWKQTRTVYLGVCIE